MTEKEVKQELTEKEVNVYGSCREPKVACLVDCPNHDPFLSTAH